MPLDAMERISEEGLAKIEEVVARLVANDGFWLDGQQVYGKTVVATFKWEQEAPIHQRIPAIGDAIGLAMTVRALTLNLREAWRVQGELRARLDFFTNDDAWDEVDSERQQAYHDLCIAQEAADTSGESPHPRGDFRSVHIEEIDGLLILLQEMRARETLTQGQAQPETLAFIAKLEALRG